MVRPRHQQEIENRHQDKRHERFCPKSPSVWNRCKRFWTSCMRTTPSALSSQTDTSRKTRPNGQRSLSGWWKATAILRKSPPTAINEFIRKIVVHERDVKGARYAVQRIEVYFNYIGKFENELTEEITPSEQKCRRMREEIDKAKHEKELAYHRAYNKAYRARHLEERRTRPESRTAFRQRREENNLTIDNINSQFST